MEEEEDNPTMFEILFDKAETYGKTTLKLKTYQAIDTASDISSSLASKIILGLFALMVFLLASIGLALWIGEQLGEISHGFFAVAGIYLVVGVLIFFLRDMLIKIPVSNFIISKLQKYHGSN